MEKRNQILIELKRIVRCKNIPLQRYQKIVGKLRHTALGIPTGKGLFTPLCEAIRTNPRFFHLNKSVKLAFRYWKVLINMTTSTSINVKQLVARFPEYIGECDVCTYGLGGVWFQGSDSKEPIVWRLQLPKEISDMAISRKYLISISELEMAAHLVQFIILEYIVPLKYKSVGIFSDNTPTIFWATKLCVKHSMIVGILLRTLALRNNITNAAHVVTSSIPGK